MPASELLPSAPFDLFTLGSIERLTCPRCIYHLLLNTVAGAQAAESRLNLGLLSLGLQKCFYQCGLTRPQRRNYA